MLKLGKLIVLTQSEAIKLVTLHEAKELADKARKQGYHAGNQAKNAAKRKGNETERLLAAIAPGVVLPSRNAETYEKPKADILDVMKMTWVGPDDPTPSSTIDVRTYGDSLPITAGELLSEINPQQDAA